MNKELLGKIIDYNYGEFGTEFGDALVDLKNKNNELVNINEKLSLALESAEQRIDKATNYINENWGHWCSNHCKYATETINILKGKE